MNTRDIGDAAEDRASLLLQRRGYRIEARNVRNKHSELDVIAWDGDTLCFVEVRYRKNADFGSPLSSIGHDKQRRIIRGARLYLSRMREEVPVRFDVLGIWRDNGDEKHALIQGAFVARD